MIGHSASLAGWVNCAGELALALRATLTPAGAWGSDYFGPGRGETQKGNQGCEKTRPRGPKFFGSVLGFVLVLWLQRTKISLFLKFWAGQNLGPGANAPFAPIMMWHC